MKFAVNRNPYPLPFLSKREEEFWRRKPSLAQLMNMGAHDLDEFVRGRREESFEQFYNTARYRRWIWWQTTTQTDMSPRTRDRIGKYLPKMSWSSLRKTLTSALFLEVGDFPPESFLLKKCEVGIHDFHSGLGALVEGIGEFGILPALGDIVHSSKLEVKNVLNVVRDPEKVMPFLRENKINLYNASFGRMDLLNKDIPAQLERGEMITADQLDSFNLPDYLRRRGLYYRDMRPKYQEFEQGILGASTSKEQLNHLEKFKTNLRDCLYKTDTYLFEEWKRFVALIDSHFGKKTPDIPEDLQDFVVDYRKVRKHLASMEKTGFETPDGKRVDLGYFREALRKADFPFIDTSEPGAPRLLNEDVYGSAPGDNGVYQNSFDLDNHDIVNAYINA